MSTPIASATPVTTPLPNKIERETAKYKELLQKTLATGLECRRLETQRQELETQCKKLTREILTWEDPRVWPVRMHQLAKWVQEIYDKVMRSTSSDALTAERREIKETVAEMARISALLVLAAPNRLALVRPAQDATLNSDTTADSVDTLNQLREDSQECLKHLGTMTPQDLIRACRGLKKENEQLQTSREILQKRLAEVSSEHEELQKKLKEKNIEINTLQSSLANHTTQIQNLTRALQDSRTQNEGLAQQLQELQMQNQTLEKLAEEKAKWNSKASLSLYGQIQTLKKQLAELQAPK